MTDHIEELAENMIRAAEEQVTKAQQMLDQTKALVDIMRNQVTAHAKQSDEMVARFNDAAARMLEIHHMLNGTTGPGMGEQGTAQRQRPVTPHGVVERAPLRDIAGLRAAAGLHTPVPDDRRAGIGTLDRDISADRGHPEDRAGYKDLQRALAAVAPAAASDPVRRS
jgi:hypothetical protein